MMLKLRFAWAVASVLVLSAAAAQAQQPVLNVQVINVCDDGGNNCALSSPYAGYGYNAVATQRIFDQAGVTVNLLAPINYDNSAYLNPAVIDDPAHGYLTGSPTDPAHQLINLPGHYQSTVPNVLDLWFVNTIPHLQADGSSLSPLFGVALLNANGAIVTTGDNGSGYISGPDNVAHELAHNLGLTHTDGPPLQGLTVEAGTVVTPPAPPGTYPDPVPIDTTNNLLDGLSRLVPLNPCAIASPTCAGVIPPSGKDLLLPFQAAQINAQARDLFSVGGLTATAQVGADGIPSYATCTMYSSGCVITVSLSGPPGSTDSLSILKIRFNYALPDNVLALIGSLGSCGSSGSPVSLPGGGSEIDVSFAAGCFTPGTTDAIDLTTFQAELASLFASESPFQGAPFSFEFDFAGGLTSLANFDSSGQALSTLPVALSTRGADPTGPGLPVPTDPAQFNAESITEENSTVPVPEPSSMLLLGVGLSLAGLLARRPRIR